MGEGAADRLEDRRPFALGGGFAELGQQQREVGEERAAVGERVGVGAQPRAQGGDDRPVGNGGAVGGGAAEDDRRRRLAASCGEAALADPGLAGEKQEIEPCPSCARSTASLKRASSSARPTSGVRVLILRSSLGATSGATL